MSDDIQTMSLSFMKPANEPHISAQIHPEEAADDDSELGSTAAAESEQSPLAWRKSAADSGARWKASRLLLVTLSIGLLLMVSTQRPSCSPHARDSQSAAASRWGELLSSSSTADSSDSQPLNSWVRNFRTLLLRGREQCAGAMNTVRNRQDAANVDAPSERRDWSVHAKTYHTHMTHETKTVAMPESMAERWNMPLPLCTSTRALQDSLRNGRRSPVDSELVTIANVAFDQFKDLSFWTPANCNFRWLAPTQACQVLSAYSDILWEGDSMVRHTVQALTLLLSGDPRHGAIPRGSPANLFACQCDGSFSEHADCRHGDHFAWNDGTNQWSGYCDGQSLEFTWDYRGITGQAQSLCDSPRDPLERRPILVYFSSGLRDGVVAGATLGRLREQLNIVSRLHFSCASLPQGAREVHVLFGGMPWAHKKIEEMSILHFAMYPDQSSGQMRRFDTEMESLLARDFPHLKVSYLHWGELSRGAATSDGFHLLTEGNLLRIQYLLNWMALRNKIEIREAQPSDKELSVIDE